MIEDLNEGEIDAFLRRQRVGRIGCHADGRTYVVPVIYVWDAECVYVQSIEGRKIQMMRANPQVCFEVDQNEPDGSWRSVILEGVYEELEGSRTEAALALLVKRLSGRPRARTAGTDAGRVPDPLHERDRAARRADHDEQGDDVGRAGPQSAPGTASGAGRTEPLQRSGLTAQTGW